MTLILGDGALASLLDEDGAVSRSIPRSPICGTVGGGGTQGDDAVGSMNTSIIKITGNVDCISPAEATLTRLR